MKATELGAVTWRKSSRSSGTGACTEVACLGTATWRKSSRSSATGQCTEVACLGTATWRKSSRSSGTGQCTEVAYLGAGVAVRDSKDPHGPALLFSPAAWQAFTAGLKAETPTG